MQNVGAVRIEHALGIAGGAGGVAHAGGGALVERLPFEIAVDFADPVFIGDGVLERGLGHMRDVGQDHVTLDSRELVGDFFQQRHECQVRHHDAVGGVVDDPDNLIGEQPRIDRVIDRADPHDAVPGLEMPPGIPGQRRHPVAELDAVFVQPLRHLQGAGAELLVIGFDDRAFDRAGDDFTIAVKRRGMIDDAVAQQRPVLHEPKHGIPLLDVLFWAGVPAGRGSG